MHHWDGAVALGIHLGEATRLVARGHQEDVSTGDDLVLPLGREPDVAHDLALVLSLCPPEEVGISLLSAAHHHELHVACDALGVPGDEPGEDLFDQVDTLLGGKAPDEAHERDVLPDLQPELSLQQLLGLRLARGLCGREADALGNEELVVARVPLVHVDAVEDPDGVREAEASDFMHPPGSLEGHDLIAVGWSDCADLV
mmetsp:Transcript_18294/g.60118  ORF Transcript_18294/g.60118 Transcript_18294/m.60118 type:complete len:200 (-) Transcript_18294:1355-1954(-)